MQTRIGHVHICYRVPQASRSSTTVAALNRVARERIAAVCDNALSKTFEVDNTVYVVRRVSARVAILSKHLDLESRIAEQWGHRLCAAVVKSIAEQDRDNVVRFENQAEFVARFLTDLVAGEAWNLWYYGAFHNCREMSIEDAILAVLEENRNWFWEILRRLRQSGILDVVLALLGQRGQKKLWAEIVRGEAREESADAFRIFVLSAFRIVAALDLWSAEPPEETTVVSRYLLTRPTAPQWHSSISLADAVADILRFLLIEGWASLPESLSSDQISRFELTLDSTFDWLDKQHLTSCVRAIFQPQVTLTSERVAVLRPPGASPSHIRLLEDLRRLLREGSCRLDPGDPAAHSNLLRLLAALSEDADSSSNAQVADVLESIVEVWMMLRRIAGRSDGLSYLRGGQLEAILTQSRDSTRADGRRHLQAVVQLGAPAIALVEELLSQTTRATVRGPTVCLESQCAGLFLLVRALQDIRLTAVLRECGFETIEPLLTGLALAIGGSASWINETLDPGAALWAGIQSEEMLSSLQFLDRLDLEQFEQVLRDLLAAQRLIDPLEAFNPQGDYGPLPCSDESALLVKHTAAWVLRAWARWLPGLSNSSIPYLLRNFIRRPGTIEVGPLFLEIGLAAAPLDSILRMAGYLSDSPGAAWLGNRTIRFRTDS
jgi:hypothetical protein